MTLDEAIEHAKRTAARLSSKRNCTCASEHEQIASWLEELRDLRMKGMAQGLELVKQMCEEHVGGGGCRDCRFSMAGICMFRLKPYPTRWPLKALGE